VDIEQSTYLAQGARLSRFVIPHQTSRCPAAHAYIPVADWTTRRDPRNCQLNTQCQCQSMLWKQYTKNSSENVKGLRCYVRRYIHISPAYIDSSSQGRTIENAQLLTWLHTHVADTCMHKLNFMTLRFCYVALHNRYTLSLENVSWNWQRWFAFFVFSFCSFPSLSLHAMPCFMPSFLNMTVLHYNVSTKAVYNQTINRLVVG
jgi:hypothetical protein